MLNQQVLKEKMNELFREARNYANLQKESVCLTLAEKLTLLLSWISTLLIAILLLSMVIFFLCMTLANWIGQMSSPAIGYGIVALLIALLLFVIYKLRHHIFTEPIAKAMMALFEEQNPDRTAKDMHDEDDEDSSDCQPEMSK